MYWPIRIAYESLLVDQDPRHAVVAGYADLVVADLGHHRPVSFGCVMAFSCCHWSWMILPTWSTVSWLTVIWLPLMAAYSFESGR